MRSPSLQSWFAAAIAVCAPVSAPVSALVSALVFVPVSAGAEGLVPHSANYNVAGYLLEDAKGKPVVRGSAEIEYHRHCGAWRLSYTLRYKGVVDDEPTSYKIEALIEEAKGGQGLTFTRAITKNGRKSILRGSAKFRPREGGEAFVEGPKGRVIVPLPAGTLFPAAYYSRLVNSLSRQVDFRTQVFGFAQSGALLNVRAVIQKPDGPPKTKMSPALRSKALWLVRFGFFDGAHDDQRRTRGAGMMVNANGVQLTFQREQGWLLVKGWLTEATALVEKPCARRDSASRTIQ